MATVIGILMFMLVIQLCAKLWMYCCQQMSLAGGYAIVLKICEVFVCTVKVDGALQWKKHWSGARINENNNEYFNS